MSEQRKLTLQTAEVCPMAFDLIAESPFKLEDAEEDYLIKCLVAYVAVAHMISEDIGVELTDFLTASQLIGNECIKVAERFNKENDR